MDTVKSINRHNLFKIIKHRLIPKNSNIVIAVVYEPDAIHVRR